MTRPPTHCSFFRLVKEHFLLQEFVLSFDQLLFLNTINLYYLLLAQPSHKDKRDVSKRLNEIEQYLLKDDTFIEN